MNEVTERITAYLAGGGLFNPELAKHDTVRDLLIDCRAAIAAAAPPAQERIDTLELEVRQLTEQIAELRGGGAAKEYAELPESCYEDDSGLKTYDSGDMRTFADATHALRIQQPAPSAAPEEPLQAFDSPRAKSLMRAWEEGWEACRDAEYVGEEAQNDAFNSSYTLTLCLAEDQLLPTPQADSQPVILHQEAARAMLKEMDMNDRVLAAIDADPKKCTAQVRCINGRITTESCTTKAPLISNGESSDGERDYYICPDCRKDIIIDYREN